jgi:hypothetical protein
VLSEEEVRAIERSRKHVREPAQLVRFIDCLLQDRRELRAQLEEIRARLRQAFKHFDRLCVERANTDWIRSRLDAGRAYLDRLFVPRKRYGTRGNDDRH